MIYQLFTIVTFELIGAFILFKRDFCCPAVLLTGGFWISILWCCAYQDHWDGFSNPLLFTLITGSLLSFSSACLIISILDKPILVNRHEKLTPIFIETYKLYIYLAVELCMIAVIMFVVFRNVSSRNPFMAIGEYYYANKYGRLNYSPGYFKTIPYFNISGVFLISYMLMNNKICKAKNTIVSYINVFVGVIISLLTGVRNTFFMFVISGIVLYFMLKGMNNGWRSNITLKNSLKLMVLLVLIVMLFKISLILTGRSDSEFTFIEILSTYVGSPIKNLELFLSESYPKSEVFGGQTLLQWYRKLYRITGKERYNIASYYKYRWIGNTGLGNVYTILMPLFQDYGLYGSYVAMAIIGVVSQKMYDNIKKCTNNRYFNIPILIYSYSAFAIAFSFFSNKFFEMVLSTALIYTLIGFYILIKAFRDIVIINGRIIIKCGKKRKKNNLAKIGGDQL